MSLLQKLLARFGADYIVVLDDSSARVQRVKKLAPGVWVTAISGTRIKPKGLYKSGYPDVTWKPLTSKVADFYKAETIQANSTTEEAMSHK